MAESTITDIPPGERESQDSISIVQRGNLKTLEQTLRRQWRLGQNIVLCWSADERGLLVIFVPHYFLGNYCAGADPRFVEGEDNEAFVRKLISGRRRKTREQLFKISERLDVAPTFIKLNTALTEDKNVLEAVEQLIRRYGLSYVESRAVVLLDIVEFSLHTPFEQASQLNSLSYSLNSAYNKLLAQGIEVNFARTTTGDGYYIWNRDLGPAANQDLFYFMLLVVADNAVARAASRGNTVPVIRTAYHIGGHYELYQAEGVNPTVFSYIVGDVTIELARMVDLAQAHQILIGDFHCESPSWKPVTDTQAGARAAPMVAAPTFVSACNRGLASLKGIQLSGKAINSLACHLTEGGDPPDRSGPRRFRIVDKHGLSRHAYNLQIAIELEGQGLSLGLDDGQLPHRSASAAAGPAPDRQPGAAPSTEELFDDLAVLLKKRNPKAMTED
ncbi:MAG: hypothetical protein OEV88_02545 [Gammaproteobacteria bacterium]|nr:hypothetical protein [Gammaproteobacteria bacterium]